ncbi:MAG: type III-B CRISPR module RAMP protein Cmr4 [Actinobacteria bacterium]|nr:type III-B CRISPR module RAMP protein Cmr4 [Actinomycetota bacterium]
MFTASTLFSFYTETSLHAGGETTISFVDQPIQREKYTDLPFIASSGIKGAIREWFESSGLVFNLVNTNKMIKDELDKIIESNLKPDGIDNAKIELVQNEINKIITVFGPEKEGADHAGAVSFTDARLLLFPVKSVKGVFAYVTCPLLLNRLIRDLTVINQDAIIKWKVPTIVSNKCVTLSDSDVKINERVILEEYPFDVQSGGEEALKNIKDIATFIQEKFFPSGTEYKFWQDKLLKDLVILRDDDFRDFAIHSTEIQTRIKIGKDKSTDTEKGGNLFTEENILPDTLFYTLVFSSNPHSPEDETPEDVNNANKVIEYMKRVNDKRFQIGGDETIGKGIVKVKFLGV